jgi:hypothetical protein
MLRKCTHRFIEMNEALGALAVVASQSLALEYETPEGAFRIVYIRANGKIGLDGWMLKKAERFKTDEARMELLQELMAIGFGLSTRNPNGEPSFDLPIIDDVERWEKLRGYFARIIEKLSSPSTPRSERGL